MRALLCGPMVRRDGVGAADACDRVLGLEHGVGDETLRVSVDESVEDACALLAGCHDTGKPEFGEVLGDAGWSLADGFGDIADGVLALSEEEDYAHAGRVGEHPENLGGELHGGAVELEPEPITGGGILRICMHTQIVSHFTPPVDGAGPRGQEQIVLGPYPGGMSAVEDFARHPIDPTSKAKLAEAGLRYATLDTSDPAAFSAWARADLRGFLAPEPSEKSLEGMRASLGYRRTTGVWDETAPLAQEPIATVSSWPADLTLPGAKQLQSWAISSVTVSQARRRRGIARNLLEGELRTAVALGIPLAALTVSESTIYGRFGFGPATFSATMSIHTRRVRWSGPTPAGRVDYVSREQWGEQIAGLFDRARLSTVGEIEGWDGMWPRLAGTVHDEEGDGKKLRAITYTSASGALEGAAIFKLEGGDEDYSSHTLSVEFMRTVSDDAYAALWRFFVEADLVATVKAEQLAIDEPVRWMLGDQRAATVTTSDHQWLRILDTKAVLEARSYTSPGVLALEVDDALGFAGGAFVLTVGADGAGTVEAVDTLPEGSPALRLPVDALASLLLGGVAPAALRAAGALSEISDGALLLAGRMLRVSPEPAPGIWY